MSLVLQVSDTHFGTERPDVVEALVDLAAAERPELVVLSGDITQRARRRQFAAARRFADRLAAAAVLAIPGNHDVPLFSLAARLFAPYAAYAEAFGGQLEPEYESDGLLVLGVNTTRAWRHKHGELSAQQVERVAARLKRCPPEKLRVVVAHHPLCVPSALDEANVARGAERALTRWSAAGADLVMGGHIHLPYVRRVHRLWVVQAGTAVSHRVRAGGGEANSVNLVRCVPGGLLACEVERWEHHAGRFALAERVVIPRAR